MNALCSNVEGDEGEMNCNVLANAEGFSHVEFISAESLLLVHVITHLLPLGRSMRVILQFIKCSLSG